MNQQQRKNMKILFTIAAFIAAFFCMEAIQPKNAPAFDVFVISAFIGLFVLLMFAYIYQIIFERPKNNE